MEDKSRFATRLKLIRKSHSLTHLQLSRICVIDNQPVISQSTLSTWENGKKIGGSEAIILLCDIFGVSADWLLGRVKYPYSSNVFEILEPTEFPISIEYEGKNVPLKYVDFPEEYLDPCKREKEYDDEVRANIIYLLYLIKYEAEVVFRDKYLKEKYEKNPNAYTLFYKLLNDMIYVSPDMNNLKVAIIRLNQILKSKKAIFIVRELGGI